MSRFYIVFRAFVHFAVSAFLPLAVCIPVLHDAAVGAPVFLTKNGCGRYAIFDIQDFEKTQATICFMSFMRKYWLEMSLEKIKID